MSGGESWRLDREGSGRAALRFDRPGSSQNSLDSASMLALDEHLRAIAADPSVTALAIRSGKPKGFCAGADLKELAACRDAAAVEAFLRVGWAALDRLTSLAIPTVAVIRGVCLGGGLELALACRHRLAVSGEPAARIGTPEVLLGLIPGWGAIAGLPRLVGLETAIPLLIGGQAIAAESAREIGLVDRVADAGGVDEAIAAILGEPTDRRGGRDDPPSGWREALSEARSGLPGGDPGPDHARRRLLDVLAVEFDEGPAAGREAAIRGLSELAMTAEAREALDAFARRSAPGKSGNP